MIRNRTFYAVLLVAALLVAGVLSYYASGSPDGLEYVAGETGFLGSAQEHASADGPLADYGVRGIDDSRLSGGLAGVIGVVVCLALGLALTWLVRRRSTPDA
ncbi:PDGLE domain-containing protein [Nocardioides sp.]|uniref:PDGLE domain-containing protein n=1 Tax=Nocardioides sp. TaxID=35761 RepID=UPI002BACBDFE|nr:PDGLE domain-containing protein [Nocardioides sp.]HSX67035.1 PDGLE domain-containing protein [Nocardioides sp.]